MQITKESLKILILLSASLLFFSCETTTVLTDVLNSVSDVAQKNGDSTVAAITGAAATVSKAAEDITPENEYYIGRSVAASIANTYSVYENPKKEAYVNKIAQVLLLNSDGQNAFNGYHVKILDSKEVNAFATSGGHIFITRGLLDCAKSEDEIAAAIAHEISHIQLKHSTNVIRSSRITDVGKKTTSAILTINEKEELAKAMDGCVGDVINQLVTKGYSKEQEYMADENALILMNDAGYNPKIMIDLLSHIQQISGNAAGGMFKTHPSPADRIKRVEKKLQTINIVEDTSKFRQERFKKAMM